MTSNRIVQPASPEVEEAAIAASILGANDAWLTPHRRQLSPDSFTVPLWRDCWTVLEAMWDADEARDPVTVAHRVWRMHPHGHEHEGQLAATILEPVTRAGVEFWTLPNHAKTLADLALRRRLIEVSADVTREAHADEDAAGVHAYALAVLDQMNAHNSAEEQGDIDSILESLHAGAEGESDAFSTGLPDWDDWLDGGFRPGETHVVGAPTGHGKSWIGVQAAAASALAGRKVLYLSIEMRPTDMWVRFLSVCMGRAAYRIRGSGPIWTAAEWQRFNEAAEHYRRAGLRVMHQQRTIADHRAVVGQHRPELVVVDYLQLISTPDRARSLYEQATIHATALQDIAARTGAVVLILTQMSRDAIKAKGQGGIPGGMDSGRIDQVADSWVLVTADDDKGFTLEARKVRNAPRPGGSAVYRLDPHSGGLVRVGGTAQVTMPRIGYADRSAPRD